MGQKNWQQVKDIFVDVIHQKVEVRQQFLARVCDGNKELRREVESLLSSYNSAESFMESPAVVEIAETLFVENSQFISGQVFGHYKIIEKIGKGGMGEVFLAEDTSLKRRIALKILPAAFSQDQNYLRRFEQEACAASALNHPNILTVHEFGEENGKNFIASEFVEGKTLHELLGGGKNLNLHETLDIALQVAAALHAAHESGIIHRDIKPENVMIREDGLVKVLDFGLAKLTLIKNEVVGAEDETQINTAPGMVMGTAAYMSPEQTRGKDTDTRTDIWSLGVVLYEMLSGHQAFGTDNNAETISAILNDEPPLTDIPIKLQPILRKSLMKNKAERYQTVQDFLLDLKTFKYELEVAPLSDADTDESLKETTQSKIIAPDDTTLLQLEISTINNRSDFATNPTKISRLWMSNRKLTAFMVLIALAGVVVLWKIISQNPDQASSNILASLRIKPLFSWDAEAGEGDAGARFSPNGTMIAYSRTKNGQRNIWTKQVPDGKQNQLTDGKWNYSNPIWSPDNQRIAFVSNRNSQITVWAMPFSGGELTPIKTIEEDRVKLLHWSKNGGTIYYQQRFNLFALDIDSRQITQLTNFDEINRAQYINISPNEDRIAYSSGSNERLHIFVMPIGGGQPVQVTDNDKGRDEYPFWLPDGNRIIYSSTRDGIFQTRIAYLGEHKTEPINLGISDTLISDVSSSGDKILFNQSREESDLWQVNIDEKSETQITSDSGLELWSDVSPDGKSIGFQSTTESKHLLEGSIQILSIDNDQQIRIASNGFSPTFSPDGRKVAFLRDADNLINLWMIGRNGEDERQLTTEGIWFSGFSIMPYNRVQVKDYSWSPDGNDLIYCAKNKGLWNVWQVAADATNAPQQITRNTDANVRFSSPIFASDGKRIIYLSSAVMPSADAKTTTKVFLLNGENSEIIFSSESVFKLIGWEQSGKSLLIAMPEDKPDVKPIKVRLARIFAENNRTDLASIEAAYFYNIQLSPDGRRIALATREDGKDTIRVISNAGGENAKITATADQNVYVSAIAWSPDSKTVYYSKQKQVRTISIIENFK